jgi:hypothetical protein
MVNKMKTIDFLQYSKYESQRKLEVAKEGILQAFLTS